MIQWPTTAALHSPAKIATMITIIVAVLWPIKDQLGGSTVVFVPR